MEQPLCKEGLNKLKHRISIGPSSSPSNPKDLKTGVPTKMYVGIFIALFTIAKMWKRCSQSSRSEFISKTWHFTQWNISARKV